MIHDAVWTTRRFQRVECVGIDRVLRLGKRGTADEQILRRGFECFDALYAFFATAMKAISLQQTTVETCARRTIRRFASVSIFGSSSASFHLADDRANRHHANRAGREKEMDQSVAFSSRFELLHALPGPERSSWRFTSLAFAQNVGALLPDRFSSSLNLCPLGAELHLRGVRQHPWIAAVFYGLKPAVTAIVMAAVIRIGRKALRNELMWALATLAFIAIYFFKVPFPMIVLSAGLIGFFGRPLLEKTNLKFYRVTVVSWRHL